MLSSPQQTAPNPYEQLLRATSLLWPPLLDPRTHRIRRLSRRRHGRVEPLHPSHRTICLPSPVSPPPIEADLAGDRGVVASTPHGSIAKPAHQFRVVACQRQVVDRFDPVAIRRCFEVTWLNGPTEQNRLASLMNMNDKPDPEIPVLLDVVISEAPERGEEDVALQDDDFRKCVKQEFGYRRLASPARAGHDQEWETANSGFVGASRAGDDRPTWCITPDRTIHAEPATPLADLLHHRALTHRDDDLASQSNYRILTRDLPRITRQS